jgi:hypothetical protein
LRRRIAWKVEENTESYVVVDGLGQKLAFLYFEDQPQRQMSMRRLGRDDAWRIARAITRIPALLRRDAARSSSMVSNVLTHSRFSFKIPWGGG